MKIKCIKKILCLILAICMTLSIAACGSQEVVIQDMEVEEVHAVSFDFLGGQDVMPISGYYGPYSPTFSSNGDSFPNYVTDEMFTEIAECGVNLFHYTNVNYEKTPDRAITLLKMGEKYNIGVFVNDTTINSPTPGGAPSLETMDERIQAYSKYPAFCGMYVVDEPGTPYLHPTANQKYDISTFAPVFQNLKTLGIVGSGNMHPLWANSEREKYSQMLDEFCSTCSPPYLSTDFYLWDEGRTKDMFFYNMDIIRQYAEKYEIPFWWYIQAGGQWRSANDEERSDSVELYPTEGQLLWNVNVALAYGAKGIQYFPLIQPIYFSYAESTEFDFQRNGIFGAAGNKTQWWYYAQKANKQIAAVDTVLMNSVNKGVIVTGETAKDDTKESTYLIDGTSWRELKEVEGNAMIGCFNYRGKTALYVVNYEEAYAQKIILNLQDAYNLSVTQNTEVSTVHTNQLTLDMQPGEGVLVVFD